MTRSKDLMAAYVDSPFVMAPRQQRSIDALVRIVTAAETVLRKQGEANFSMLAVASEAHLPVANIYRRFKSKEELLLAIKDAVGGRLHEDCVAAINKTPTDDLFATLFAFTGAMAKGFARDEVLHTNLFSVRNPALTEIGARNRNRGQAYFVQVLSRWSFANAKHPEFVKAFAYEIIMNGLLLPWKNRQMPKMSWTDLHQELAQAAYAYLSVYLVEGDPKLA